MQLLLDQGLGSAGVAIDGAAVKGITALPLSEIKSTFPVLKNPANRKKAVPITEKQFNYAFTNNLSLEESKPFYDRYAIPVSGRMLFQGGFANFASGSPMKVNFANNDRTVAAHRRWERPHPAAGGPARDFQQAQQEVHSGHNVQALPRP